jgi:hypothetical protein
LGKQPCLKQKLGKQKAEITTKLKPENGKAAVFKAEIGKAESRNHYQIKTRKRESSRV